VGLTLVDPALGVPVYLMLVGSPDQISFEFQYLLDTYWCVGRLDFPSAAEYRAYAERVVAYENSPSIPQRRQAAIFATMHPGDRPTGLFHNQVALPLLRGSDKIRPLGQKFQIEPLLAAEATKENLAALLQGKRTGAPPALLFSGSHGLAFPLSDTEQAVKQGAILCQDFPGSGPVDRDHYFAASDLPPGASLLGMIHFLFGCYGGGCPKYDTFSRRRDGSPKQIMADTVVARLPQKILAAGGLAVLAHIDRAWACSFQNSQAAPQVQEFRTVLVKLMQGQRIGLATDELNLRWAVLSAELSMTMASARTAAACVSTAEVANRWVARNDARNYVILGDPAVRLRVECMAA
jgi:hypothetical protein